MKLPLRVSIPLLALLPACASTGTGPDTEQEIATLARWMTGTFSSEAQAAEDPDHYFEIRLVMLPIWTDRDDGPWLYVEQAAFSSLERPYRQRAYHLMPGGPEAPRSIHSEVYTVPGDPLELAAAWQAPEKFEAFGPEALELRTGCTIVLEVNRAGDTPVSFVGSTVGKGCGSTLGGAAHATSEVIITEGLLESWDRGFDAEGEQAWGATEGAYRFLRLLDTPPVD